LNVEQILEALKPSSSKRYLLSWRVTQFPILAQIQSQNFGASAQIPFKLRTTANGRQAVLSEKFTTAAFAKLIKWHEWKIGCYLAKWTASRLCGATAFPAATQQNFLITLETPIRLFFDLGRVHPFYLY